MADLPSVNRDKALEAISKHLNGQEVSMDTVLSELEMDSEDLREIHFQLGHIFDLDLPHFDVVEPVTVGDMVFVVLDEIAAKRQINQF